MYKNETRYALINGVLLDGTRDMTPQTGKVVCVEGGKIAAVTEGPVPAGYEPVDLAGRYILPGLINLHVHLPASGKPKKKPSDPKKLVKLITSNGLMRRVGVKLCESYARTELLSGVTTIRTVGGVADFDTIIREKAAAGEILSPRVVASNMAVSVPGGHMAGSLAYEARTPEEAAAYVERIAAEKPDLIKLMITGGVLDAEVVGEPGVLRMPPALVKAACDKAHSLGMLVAAHVESPEGVIVALQNGVDSIEHGAYLGQETLHRLAESRTVWVPTLVTFGNLIGCGRFPDAVLKPLLEGAMENVRRAAALGALIAPGSDAGAFRVLHGQGTLDEYALLKAAIGDGCDEVLSRGIREIQARF